MSNIISDPAASKYELPGFDRALADSPYDSLGLNKLFFSLADLCLEFYEDCKIEMSDARCAKFREDLRTYDHKIVTIMEAQICPRKHLSDVRATMDVNQFPGVAENRDTGWPRVEACLFIRQTLNAIMFCGWDLKTILEPDQPGEGGYKYRDEMARKDANEDHDGAAESEQGKGGNKNSESGGQDAGGDEQSGEVENEEGVIEEKNTWLGRPTYKCTCPQPPAKDNLKGSVEHLLAYLAKTGGVSSAKDALKIERIKV